MCTSLARLVTALLITRSTRSTIGAASLASAGGAAALSNTSSSLRRMSDEAPAPSAARPGAGGVALTASPVPDTVVE